jgi:hypothetical protein
MNRIIRMNDVSHLFLHPANPDNLYPLLLSCTLPKLTHYPKSLMTI